MNDTSAPRQNPALIDQFIDLDPAAPVEVSADRDPGPPPTLDSQSGVPPASESDEEGAV